MDIKKITEITEKMLTTNLKQKKYKDHFTKYKDKVAPSFTVLYLTSYLRCFQNLIHSYCLMLSIQKNEIMGCRLLSI